MRTLCGTILAAAAFGAAVAEANDVGARRAVANDTWYGFYRTVFEFQGQEAWIVKPKTEVEGRPWAWIMEWPTAFAKRTGSVALLAAGFHVVTLRPGYYENGKFVSKPGNMNDARLRDSREFQKYLVDELHFAPKANLIGMSWGGFYSVRYAGTYPDAVSRIYLDAPLLDFSTLVGKEGEFWGLNAKYGIDVNTYVGKDDPRQPVNMYEPIAKAGIPILLLYGGVDATVPPSKNCLRFADAFKAAGGNIEIVARGPYGHWPHGLEIDEQQKFVDFFSGATPRPAPRPALAARLAAGPEIYGIVHWGLNTYTDREWGFGDEDPAMLTPDKFDADQIVGACKAGGIGGLIIVSKHHDGFCLWPTKTTEHNITKSPFWKSWSPKPETGRDYVKEMEQACRRAGIKFGVYVSPWDRNNAAYGTEKYVTDVFQKQIRELLSGDYGEIFEMWFDGANGGDGWYGGAKEKRKIPSGYYRYDTETFAMVRKLQPKVCIFNEMDEADFRFGGNERGTVDPDSRSTIGHYDGIWDNYKHVANVGVVNGTTFHPIEADFPLRRGWFYHEKERGTTKSAAYLMKLYLSSVGNAATMNIGIAPDKSGRLDADDVRALAGFGVIRKALFAHEAKDGEPFNVVVMSEDISNGEQVDEWEFVADGKAILRGKSIGWKRIRVLETPCAAKTVDLKILKDGGGFKGVSFKLYNADPELVKAIFNATGDDRETDTARWMTKTASE